MLSDSPTVVVLAAAVAVATGALALVRHTSPDRRTAVQWVLAGVLVVGIGVAYALRHQIIAWLGAGSDFSMRANLWATLLTYVRDAPGAGLGLVRPVGAGRVPLHRDELPRWAARTRPP